MTAFADSFLLMFVLLNPFIMGVYLAELVRRLEYRMFARQIVRGGIFSAVVFVLFAWAGDVIFTDVLQIRFIAFLIFGGITFLIIGTRLILGVGPRAPLNSSSDHVTGSIAMPFIVGPGTISASVLAGSRLEPLPAAGAVLSALALALAALLVLKKTHDYVRARNEKLVERYTEIAGRATALFTGSFAVEMILTGIERWIASLAI